MMVYGLKRKTKIPKYQKVTGIMSYHSFSGAAVLLCTRRRDAENLLSASKTGSSRIMSKVSSMTAAEMRAELKSLGVDQKGLKADLAKRLEEARAGSAAGEGEGEAQVEVEEEEEEEEDPNCAR